MILRWHCLTIQYKAIGRKAVAVGETSVKIPYKQHIKNVKRLLSRKYVYVRMTKAKSMPVIVETQNMSAFLSSANKKGLI